MAKKGLLNFGAIRSDTDFQSVLTHYGLMPDQSGPQLKLKCPFHDDNKPSCSVNLERSIFKCFACPEKGNVLDFIGAMEEYGDNSTFKSAKKALEIMGLNADDYRKEKSAPEKSHNRRQAKNHTKTTETTAAPKKEPTEASGPSESITERPTENPVLDIDLTLNPEHEFLTARGVGRELAETFGLGYCKAGIMKKRIAVPIHNPDGELVAFTGRWAGADDLIPEKEGKYKLPKGFRKELELFNLHRAAAMGKRYVVIVEGIWSTIRLHAEGIPTIALLGTSISEHQAALVAEAGFKHAVVILDGDEAGRNARPSVLDTLSQHVYVKTITLEEGVKPDTMEKEIVNRLCR